MDGRGCWGALAQRGEEKRGEVRERRLISLPPPHTTRQPAVKNLLLSWSETCGGNLSPPIRPTSLRLVAEDLSRVVEREEAQTAKKREERERAQSPNFYPSPSCVTETFFVAVGVTREDKKQGLNLCLPGASSLPHRPCRCTLLPRSTSLPD